MRQASDAGLAVRSGRWRGCGVVGQGPRRGGGPAGCAAATAAAGHLIRNDPIDVPREVVLVEVAIPCPGRRENLARDDAVTKPSVPGLPLLIVEDPLLVLLPEALLQIEVQLEVAHGAHLA